MQYAFFCSTLALRLDLSGDPSFSQAVQRAKKMAAEAFAHGTTPFTKVVEALGVARSAAFTPIYQVMLVVDDDERLSTEQMSSWPGLQVAGVIADRGMVVPTDLVVSITTG